MAKVGAPTEFTAMAIVIIAIGMLFQGFGKAPRQPYIITYIDDNVPKRKTACYMGKEINLSCVKYRKKRLCTFWEICLSRTILSFPTLSQEELKILSHHFLPKNNSLI
jgi:hypothetical protein